jgi:hypothetical protein
VTRLPAQIRLDELILEIRLTSKKHLVVEGNTDARFMRAWLQDVEGGARIIVTPVDDIDVPTSGLFELQLPDANRSRVIFVAFAAERESANIRCVADRDCGQDVTSHQYSTLIWTDFPAIESYAVDARTFDRANLLSFNQRLPGGDDLLPAISHALRELYAMRLAHPTMREPNYSAGLKGQRNLDGLASFDVTRAVEPQIGNIASTLPRSDADDPREFSYGHDIAGLLIAAFGNDLSNRAGLRNKDAVENALRSAVQAVGAYVSEPLFSSLVEWIAE